jgi:hypothetical protein
MAGAWLSHDMIQGIFNAFPFGEEKLVAPLIATT